MKTEFIIRNHNGYAIRFTKNLCGSFVTSVVDTDAEKFDTEDAARQKAAAHRMRGFKVEPVAVTA